MPWLSGTDVRWLVADLRRTLAPMSKRILATILWFMVGWTAGAMATFFLGLPDGLNEQAVRAAYQMRFAPAMKNGRPVSYWLSNVEIEFNLR